MSTRPTPETDKFFATFADGEAAPSHAEYYARLQDLERERDELRRWTSVNGVIELQRERDEARGQRDRLAEALKNCRDDLEMILLERLPNPSETWCSLCDADEALQSLTTNELSNQ